MHIQVHHELQRRKGAAVAFSAGDYEDAIGHVHFRPEKRYALGIGEDCGPGPGGAQFRDPLCYADNTPICDMTNCPGSALGQIGGAWFDVLIEPLRADYFQALAARFAPVDGANEDQQRDVRITAVHCMGGPRDVMDNRAPTAAEAEYISSEMFRVPDPYAIHVPWGPFGKQVNDKELHVTCFPNYAAAVTIDANIVLKGNALPSDHYLVRKYLSGRSAN